MNRPLFAVGEVVLLQSKTCPELTGEYQVGAVFEPGSIAVIGGVRKKISSTRHGYDLGVEGLGGHSVWCESALRKRHTPGEYSFDGLKHVLSMPVSREDLA